MRDLAAPYEGERRWWRATFVKVSLPPAGGPCLYLLRDVRHRQERIMDHAWIKTPRERHRGPCEGDRVAFSAIVARYTRLDGTWDFGLCQIMDFTSQKGRRR